MKPDMSCSDVHPHNNTSLTIIFDATFFRPRSLSNVFHSVCIFVLIAKTFGFTFRSLIGITFYRQFPSGVKNTSLSCTSSSATTCQYPLSMSTEIK